MGQLTTGPVVKERVWRFIEALLTRAEDSSDFDIDWEDKDTDRPKFVVKTKRRFLESLAQLKKPELTEVIKSLENLQIWDDRRLKRRKGSEIGWFALKLWSTDTQRNREQFERVWEGSRTEKSKALEATYKKSVVSAEAPQDEIDWQDCCRKMLPTALSINPLLHGDGVVLTLDDIVPLELVERKQRPQQKDDFSPEHFQVQASTEYETPIEHHKFLAQVLETGNSLKNRDRKIAVIGEPGAGKTTLLQEIAKEVEGAGGLPIFVSLADLGEKTLKDYLLEDWLEEATGKRRISEDIQDDFVNQFNLGRVWLLLDGVDEIAATGNLLSSLEKQLKGWVADARIVLTCRLNVWDVGKNDLYAFEKYRIQQLSYPDAVGDFIRRFFFKAGEPTKGEKLIEKLERSQPRIRDLVKNPLRLTLLCRTRKRRHNDDEDLPQTKAELYKGFVETFYDEWNDKPEIDEDKRPILNQALGELAKNAIDKETTKFRLRRSFVRQELDKFDKSLFDLACRVGWINNVGVAAENPDEPVYAFFHPTFQEYFAALAIADWRYFLPRAHDNCNPKPVSERYRIFEPQWKEVFLLWMGLAEEEVKKQKEEFIEALVKFEDGCSDFYKFQAYFLAAAGISEFGDCTKTKADKIVAQVAEWAFGNFKVEEYNWQTLSDPIPEAARAALRETKSGEPIAELVKRIIETEQCELIELLSEIGISNSQEAIRSLEEVICNLPDPNLPDTQFSMLYLQVPEVLLKINPNNTLGIQNLLKLINQTKDEFFRKEAIEIVGRVGKSQKEFISTLEQIVDLANGSLELLVQVADSLGKIDPSNLKVVPALVKFIEPSKDEINLRQIYENIKKSVLGDYISSFYQPIHYENARSQAFKRLEKISPYNLDAAIPALLKVINSTKDEDIRCKAINILGKIGRDNSEVITTLEKFIEPTNSENLRRIAAESLGKIYPNHSKAIEELVELTKSAKGESIYWLAARSLGEIGKGNSEAIAALEQLIKSPETGLTHSLIAEALWKIDPDNLTIAQTLEKLIKPDKDECTRGLAAETLGRIYPNHPKAIAELVKIIKLTEAESILRRVAANLNKILRQEDRMIEVVAALKEYLSDESRKNNRQRYQECYKIIWHCAQNITYPAFYHAWHPEEGGKAITPGSQSLNQANLP